MKAVHRLFRPFILALQILAHATILCAGSYPGDISFTRVSKSFL